MAILCFTLSLAPVAHITTITIGSHHHQWLTITHTLASAMDHITTITTITRPTPP